MIVSDMQVSRALVADRIYKIVSPPLSGGTAASGASATVEVST